MKELILYALRRFCMLIPFLIGLTLVAFLLGVLSPGDPALALLTMDGTSEPTAEELDALRHAMGLDQPVWIQYGRWLMNALHGDLGVSYLTQKPVLDEILRRFPITFRLAVWAIGVGCRHPRRNLGSRKKRHRRGNSPSRGCSFLYFHPFFLPGHFMHAPFF